MLKRRANSRVLGSFCFTLRSPLSIPSRIWVTSCSRRGTSLFFESQSRIVCGEYHVQSSSLRVDGTEPRAVRAERGGYSSSLIPHCRTLVLCLGNIDTKPPTKVGTRYTW